MIKKLVLASILVLAFSGVSCITDDPINDPTVIVIIPQNVPYLVKPGIIVPFDGYFVTRDQLLVMRQQIPSEYVGAVKKGDMLDGEGYLIHPNLVTESDKKLKFK